MKSTSPQAKQDFRLNNNKSTERLNCLVTGFDPFEDNPFNPSEAIVNTLPASIILPGSKMPVSLNGLVLPVCGEKAWPILKDVLNDMTANKKPCVIVMLGLAATRKNINLERFALNILDGDRKDNYGHVYSGQIIEAAAPQAMKTNAPIEGALAYLKQKGLPAEISNFCNTYVCNEIYYLVLRYFEKSRIKNSVSFVHLPPLKIYGKMIAEKGNKKTLPLAYGKTKQLEAMRLVVTSLVQYYSEALL